MLPPGLVLDLIRLSQKNTEEDGENGNYQND